MTPFEALILIPVKSRKFIEPFQRKKMIFPSFLPLTMPPRKKTNRNLAGLRNQPKQSQASSVAIGGSKDNSNDALLPGMHFDSMRVDWENDDESDIESEVDLDDFDDEEFGINLLEMAEKEDPKDLDWLPPKLQALQMRRKGEQWLE